MGFNSIIHLRVADLDAIAADPEFGKNVDTVIGRADWVLYRERNKGMTRRSGVSISEMSLETPVPYDLQSCVPQHASGRHIIHVRHGDMDPVPMNAKQWHADRWFAFCRAAATLGVQSKLGDAFDSRKEPLPAALPERERMGNWSPEVFKDATVTLVVMNDFLHDIREKQDFGARVKHLIEQTWDAHKRIMDLHDESPAEQIQGWMPNGSGFGVVGFTPWGQEDVMTIGGNTGTVLRPHTTPWDALYAHRLPEEKARNNAAVRDALRYVGFSTQVEGEARMKSAPRHMENFFIPNPRTEVAQDDTPTP